MIKIFAIPTITLSHPSLILRSRTDANALPTPFLFSFDDYFTAVMSDRWWLGESSGRGSAVNENDARSRVDASLRIQDAYEAAVAMKGDKTVRLEEADLAWLIERARAITLPQGLEPLVPKLMKFYRVLLNAAPEQQTTKTNGATTAREEQATS